MISILRNPDITDKLCFEMKDGDRICGKVCGYISNDLDLVIDELDAEQELFYDGLVRSILSFVSLRGIDRAVFSIEDERKKYRLKGFRFITEDSSVLESINKFFEEDTCG